MTVAERETQDLTDEIRRLLRMLEPSPSVVDTDVMSFVFNQDPVFGARAGLDRLRADG